MARMPNMPEQPASQPRLDRALYSGRVFNRGQIIKACEALGLDAHNVECIQITGSGPAIVTEFVRDEDGRRILTRDGDFVKVDHLYQVLDGSEVDTVRNYTFGGVPA